MAKQKINSRSKGVRGELEWRDELRKAGHEAERGQQHAGGNESPDVISSLDHIVHWEVKRTETLSPYKAMAQAARDAKPSQMPVVAHKRNGKPWLCILPAEALLALLRNGERQKVARRSQGNMSIEEFDRATINGALEIVEQLTDGFGISPAEAKRLTSRKGDLGYKMIEDRQGVVWLVDRVLDAGRLMEVIKVGTDGKERKYLPAGCYGNYRILLGEGDVEPRYPATYPAKTLSDELATITEQDIQAALSSKSKPKQPNINIFQ